jgi:hypothetical protein
VAPQDVGLVIASAHGTPADQVEIRSLSEVLTGGNPIVLAPKQRMGDSLGSSGRPPR